MNSVSLKAARRPFTLMSKLSVMLGVIVFYIGCAQEVVVTEGESNAMSVCPPELTRDDGSCWVSDPSGYNEYVESHNGETPPMEDLINVDDSIIEEQESSFLTQEGSGKFYVYTNESKRIGVRAVNNVGAPVPGIRVTFEMIADDEASDPRGSMLSTQVATTDQYGVAAVDVIAGPDPTYFKLMMEADDTTTMVYRINVIQPNIRDDVSTVPAPQRCALADVSGNYAIENGYELGRFLGDDVFNALETINRALTDPGGLIGDWIRDRIGGFIGDAVRGVVRDIINSLLRSANLPDWATGAVNAIADITGMLTDLEIKANLRFGKVQGSDCEIPGVHTWEQLVFRWQGNDCGAFGSGNCGEQLINLSEVGVSVSESEFMAKVVDPNVLVSEIEIGEHELDLNIGVIIIALLENVILPQRSGVRSFGDLIARLVPCDRFGDLAASLVSGIPFIGGSVRGLATDACRDGIRALGNDLTRRVIGQLEVNTFRVKGRADFVNRDGMPGFEAIENGRWEGDPNSNSYLQGDFEGTKR